MHVRGIGALVAVVSLATAGCGGGGGDGGPPDARRTIVLPHILDTKGGSARMALGDLNGDGLLDLLSHDPASSSVHVMESTGLRESPTRQSLGATKRFVRGEGAHAPGGVGHVLVWDTAADVACGDLDGDGRPDLVVANGPRQTVDVSFGDLTEQGTFRYHDWQWRGSPPVGSRADRVALGDVDGDGRCDLVVLDETTGDPVVLVSDPADPRSFVVGNDPPAIGACVGLVLCDMDRDGQLDIVTNQPDDDEVVVIHGPFGAPAVRESPTRASTGRCMAVGDVDGDGWLDVVVLAEGGGALVCLHQRPDGSRLFDSTSDPVDVVLDETGVQVASIAIDEPGVHVAGLAIDEPGVHRAGACVGTQGTSSVHRCVMQTGLALADLDLDGALDVVCGPPDADPEGWPIVVYGLRESPTRRFSDAHERLAPAFRESPTLPRLSRLLAVGDLDGDGRCDVITGDPDFDLLRLHYVQDNSPNPESVYELRLRESPTRASTGRALADLDRDGRPDLVCCTASGLEVRFQDPGAPLHFSPPVDLLPGLDCRCVAVGDVDGDGCPDLVVGLPGATATLLRDPAQPRAFQAPLPSPLGGACRALALGDVDGDGILDLALIRESPTRASLGRGVGNGLFVVDPGSDFDSGLADPLDLCLADVDGDGLLDVALCASDASSVVRRPGSIPSYAPPWRLETMGGVRVAAGDLDGDGRCDVVTAGPDGTLVALHSPFERGEFQPAFALSREECAGLALRDVDRNGMLDVCFVETKTGTVRVATGDPDFDLLRIVSLNGLPPGVPVLRVGILAGDLDGDGRDDLVTTHDEAGAMGVAEGVITAFSPGP